jgi:hypothetical protein
LPRGAANAAAHLDLSAANSVNTLRIEVATDITAAQVKWWTTHSAAQMAGPGAAFPIVVATTFPATDAITYWLVARAADYAVLAHFVSSAADAAAGNGRDTLLKLSAADSFG